MLKKCRPIIKMTAAFLTAFTVAAGVMPALPQLGITVSAVEAADDVEINAVHFPDDIFKQYVSENFDTDKDGRLSGDEISSVKSLDLNEMGIGSLKGIEYFTEITHLYCYQNDLTSIDLSKNTALTELNLWQNQLTSLDVSKNTALTELTCDANNLSSLDVSKNTALTELGCVSNNLTSLDLSNNTALTYLYCNYNQISSLNVSKNTALTTLYCHANQLSSLDISKNTALTNLWCYENQLTALDVSKNTALNYLFCGGNQLTTLDISKNTALTVLNCCEDQLTSLDVSNNTNLTFLFCDNNQLASLDLSKNTALTDLSCENNQYNIGNVCGAYDLENLPSGFDVKRTSNWQGAVLTGNELTEFNSSGFVTYNYNCGNGNITSFALRYDSYNTKHNYVNGVCTVCGASENSDISGSVEISAVNFPDNVFRDYVSAYIDADSDGFLSSAEIGSVKSLDLNEMGISSLKGIEYFTELTHLYCCQNDLTSIDLSKNTALEELNLWQNQLTSLDVSKNTALTELTCDANNLSSLDVSKNTALTELGCVSNNLTSLDLSNNTALTTLYCNYNQISSLNVSKNTALTTLYCHANQLTSLDVSKNTALEVLFCGGNKLTTLDVSKNTALTDLNCYEDQLTSLDVSKNTDLIFLECGNNQLTSLDVRRNTALNYLYCHENLLTSLDVSKNTALNYLYCEKNQLTSLDVSRNTSLTNLWCHENQLKSLDVSKNTALTFLSLSYNAISSIDVSKNTALTTLYCGINKLTSLDVSKNTALTFLNLSYNAISSIDVSKNTALTTLYCDNNQLTSLDLSKNTALEEFSCNNNKYHIGKICGAYDLKKMPFGFDAKRTSNWLAASLTGNKLTGFDGSGSVLYNYNCGNGYSAMFTLTYDNAEHSYENGTCSVCGEEDPDYTKPTKPVITKLTTASGKVNVQWSAVTGATRYRIYWKQSGGKWQAKNLSASATSYTVTGLTNNKGYAFLVRAEVNDKFTSYTSADMKTAVPQGAKVANPQITKLTAASGKVNVQWSAVDGATRYRIYWKQSGGAWQAKNLSASKTAYTVTGLTNNKGYAFLVRAEVNGKFTYYTADDMKTAVPRAAQVANPKITKVTTAEGKVNIQWNAVSGATRYRVYWKQSGGSWQAVNVSSSTTAYTLKNLDRNKGYAFLVRAEVNGKFTAYTSSDMVTAVPRAAKNSELETDTIEFTETDIPVFEFVG